PTEFSTMKPLLPVLAVLGFLVGCGETAAPENPLGKLGKQPSSNKQSGADAKPKPDKPLKPKEKVVIETSMGTIKLELDSEKAPISVRNFIDYVDDKFYDDTIFHRVMGKENDSKDFMIQGGGFTTARNEKETRGPIKNESGNGLSNKRGTIAMARTPA